MGKTYNKILSLAKPYLKKGRKYDYQHTVYLLKLAEKIFIKEGLDLTIMMPALILHDIGWGLLDDKYKNNFSTNKARLAHMKIGANFSKKILGNINYPKYKINKISHLISVHDNMSEGVKKTLNKKEEIILANVDFLWRISKIGMNYNIKRKNITGKNYLKIIKSKANKRNISKYPHLYKAYIRLYQNRLKEIEKGLR